LENSKSKIIILGKNGFIAKSLVNKLKQKKIKYIAYSKENLNLEKKKSISILKKIIRPNDKIVFISSVVPVKDNRMLLRNVNILTNTVAALKTKIFRQLIYLSSDAVYKDDAKIINEKTIKTPKYLHGNMHLLRENVLKNLFENKLCILRPTLIYGKNDPHNSYGPNKFLRKIKKNENIELFGKGEEKRDHVHINDVIKTIIFCLQKNLTGSLNIASGRVVSFYDIAKRCIKKNKSSKIIFLPRNGPMPHNGYRKFDIKKLMSLNLKKFINLNNYIKKY
jgi:UDP-glucose 4-epimerase